MKKIYIIDTSVMIHDPLFFNKFQDNEIVLPIQTLEELRKLKTRPGLKGFQARETARKLKELFKEKDINLEKGVTLKNGGTLRVELNHLNLKLLPDALDKSVTDYKIVSIAKALTLENKKPVIMVSKDIDIWIICKTLGVKVEDYMNDKIEAENIYDGLVEKDVSTELINTLYKEKEIKFELTEKNMIYPNSGILLKSPTNSLIGIYKNKKIRIAQEGKIPYLKGHNIEQRVGIELMLDPDINLITMTGGAGSGKTYLAISIAFHELFKTKKIKKIILIKPTQETDLGYLPGSEFEKLTPYMASYYDAFSKIIPPYFSGTKDDNTVKMHIMNLMEEGKLEMKNFSYLRGRSIDDALIIVDECQQITPHFAKLILTRAGKNTRIFLLGDISDNQIDVDYVDSKSNGLAYVVEKFKNSKLSGHITLKSVERSKLAKEAEKIL